MKASNKLTLEEAVERFIGQTIEVLNADLGDFECVENRLKLYEDYLKAQKKGFVKLVLEREQTKV